MWTITREWEGETAFVLAGGASVRELDLSPLKGRRVVAINSAWKTWPSADLLFYADDRWWLDRVNKFEGGKGFAGRVVTTASTGGPVGVLRLSKIDPSNGIAIKSHQVALQTSAVTGALNLLFHLGVARIVLLGVDGKLAADGQKHHHGTKYPWPHVAKCFEKHAAEFRAVAPSLRAAGVEVINANPGSALGVWPRMKLEDCL